MEHAEEVFDAALHLLSATPVFTWGVMIYFCPTEVKLQSHQHFKQQHFMRESACFSGISEFNRLFTCLPSHLAVLLTNTPRLHPTPPVCTMMSEWGKPDMVWTTISSDHIWSQFHALYANKHAHHWENDFYTKERKNVLSNVCRIYKKIQIIKNLTKTAFHNVYKVSMNSMTH